MAKVNGLIHTLRVVVLNRHGDDPELIGGYLRFGTNKHGEANHMNTNADCKSDFDFVTEINVGTGHIGNSKLVYFDKIVDSPAHPDSGVVVDWIIPNWNEIVEEIKGIASYFFGLEFIGFDIGITENGIKLMEINTHPGIKYMQIAQSLYSNQGVRDYFENKIREKKCIR